MNVVYAELNEARKKALQANYYGSEKLKELMPLLRFCDWDERLTEEGKQYVQKLIQNLSGQPAIPVAVKD